MWRLLSSASLLAMVAGEALLNDENWKAETKGKTVFVMFYKPECKFCQALRPAWDQLMEDYAGSSGSLVADVDCTVTGKKLCDEQFAVSGFPALKWATAQNISEGYLHDYPGGRDYKDLKEFAAAGLTPACGPNTMDPIHNYCSKEDRSKLEGYMKMSVDKLEAKSQITAKILVEDVPVMKMVLASYGTYMAMSYGAPVPGECGLGANLEFCSDKVKGMIDKLLKIPAYELKKNMDKTVRQVKSDVRLMNKAKTWLRNRALFSKAKARAEEEDAREDKEEARTDKEEL